MLLARAKAALGFEGGSTGFIGECYDRRKTFNLLVYCSGGTPRRFWELNKRAYDHGTNKVSYARVKIAAQEIVNEQILGHPSLTPDDHKITRHIINKLTRKNEEARKNKKLGKTNTPQRIYFSGTQENSPYLDRLVMQGAVYDKLRMKSRRHSLRPHPIFALDTGVAFSYRVIPENGFDLVAEKDFPRSTANAFTSAASLEPTDFDGRKKWTIEDILSTEDLRTHVETKARSERAAKIGKAPETLEE